MFESLLRRFVASASPSEGNNTTQQELDSDNSSPHADNKIFEQGFLLLMALLTEDRSEDLSRDSISPAKEVTAFGDMKNFLGSDKVTQLIKRSDSLRLKKDAQEIFNTLNALRKKILSPSTQLSSIPDNGAPSPGAKQIERRSARLVKLDIWLNNLKAFAFEESWEAVLVSFPETRALATPAQKLDLGASVTRESVEYQLAEPERAALEVSDTAVAAVTTAPTPTPESLAETSFPAAAAEPLVQGQEPLQKIQLSAQALRLKEDQEKKAAAQALLKELLPDDRYQAFNSVFLLMKKHADSHKRSVQKYFARYFLFRIIASTQSSLKTIFEDAKTTLENLAGENAPLIMQQVSIFQEVQKVFQSDTVDADYGAKIFVWRDLEWLHKFFAETIEDNTAANYFKSIAKCDGVTTIETYEENFSKKVRHWVEKKNKRAQKSTDGSQKSNLSDTAWDSSAIKPLV